MEGVDLQMAVGDSGLPTGQQRTGVVNSPHEERACRVGVSLFWGLRTKRMLLACKWVWDWSSGRLPVMARGTEPGCREQSIQDKVLTASTTKGIGNEEGEMGFSACSCAHASSWGWLLEAGGLLGAGR